MGKHSKQNAKLRFLRGSKVVRYVWAEFGV